MLSRFPTDTR